MLQQKNRDRDALDLCAEGAATLRGAWDGRRENRERERKHEVLVFV
jgi:hypothetical protein